MNIELMVLMLHKRRNPPFPEQGNNRVDLDRRKEPTSNPGSILQKRTSERQRLGHSFPFNFFISNSFNSRAVPWWDPTSFTDTG